MIVFKSNSNEKKSRFDLFASIYKKYSENKKYYLNSIDNIIVMTIPRGSKNLLDIGAGDGHRAMKIAKMSQISDIILCDPEPSMIELCKKHNVSDIWMTSAENIVYNKNKFDVILCLWNVIGHINSNDNRIKALNIMSELLSSNGLLFIDFSNRYNAKYYGYLKTFGRYIYDIIQPSELNGDASFYIKYNNKNIFMNSHFFTPKEIDRLINVSNLKIVKKYVIDYENGGIVDNLLSGQLFYILRNNYEK